MWIKVIQLLNSKTFCGWTPKKILVSVSYFVNIRWEAISLTSYKFECFKVNIYNSYVMEESRKYYYYMYLFEENVFINYVRWHVLFFSLNPVMHLQFDANSSLQLPGQHHRFSHEHLSVIEMRIKHELGKKRLYESKIGKSGKDTGTCLQVTV